MLLYLYFYTLCKYILFRSKFARDKYFVNDNKYYYIRISRFLNYAIIIITI